jgi:hypothetical protein
LPNWITTLHPTLSPATTFTDDQQLQLEEADRIILGIAEAPQAEISVTGWAIYADQTCLKSDGEFTPGIITSHDALRALMYGLVSSLAALVLLGLPTQKSINIITNSVSLKTRLTKFDDKN